MISVKLARRLRDGGVKWQPASGDRFVVADREMDDEVFTLSDMTVELHQFPHGQVIGFNGTTEWALDSVQLEDSLWLPREDQLRELLGKAFKSLCRVVHEGGAVQFQVELERPARTMVYEDADPAEAYGNALFALMAEAAT